MRNNKKPLDLDTPILGASATTSRPADACDDPEIERMLEACNDACPSEFIDDLYLWWEDKGWLTQNQYLALERIYSEICHHACTTYLAAQLHNA